MTTLTLHLPEDSHLPVPLRGSVMLGRDHAPNDLQPFVSREQARVRLSADDGAVLTSRSEVNHNSAS